MEHGKVILANSHQNMLGSVRDLLEGVFETVFMVPDESWEYLTGYGRKVETIRLRSRERDCPSARQGM